MERLEWSAGVRRLLARSNAGDRTAQRALRGASRCFFLDENVCVRCAAPLVHVRGRWVADPARFS